MNKKLLIVGGIIVAAIIGFSLSLINHPSKQQSNPTEHTTITSSTSATKATDPTVKTDRQNVFSTDETAPKQEPNQLATAPRAHYVDFQSVDQFKGTEGTRVLFFYLATSKACRTLDKDLHDNIATLDPQTTIFKIDFKKHADIAKAYGVVRESTILKFDDSGEVNGIFIAADYPTAQALKTNLQI